MVEGEFLKLVKEHNDLVAEVDKEVQKLNLKIQIIKNKNIAIERLVLACGATATDYMRHCTNNIFGTGETVTLNRNYDFFITKEEYLEKFLLGIFDE